MSNSRREFLKTVGTAVLAGCGDRNPPSPRDEVTENTQGMPDAGSQVLQEVTTSLSTANRNILLVVADEMRFPMHFAGDPSRPDSPDNVVSATTYLQKYMPNLSRLKERSVSFSNHHTAATACTPARASLFTGLYGHQHNLLVTLLPAQERSGDFPLIPVLDPQFPTMGTVLAGLGYEATYIGKWHLSYPASHGNSIASYGPPDFQNLQHLFANGYLTPYGFKGGTYPDPEGGAPATGALLDPQICEGFSTWNRAIRPGVKGPWFTVVSLVQPHDAQFFWDGPIDNPLKPSSFYPDANEQVSEYALSQPLPTDYQQPPKNLENFAQQFESENFAVYRAAQANDMINGAISFDAASTTFEAIPTVPAPAVASAPEYTTVAPHRFWREALNHYALLHQDLDKSIGKLLAQIEQMPEAQQPILVFTSDHGEYAGSHGLRGKGYTGFRESTQVPLLVHDTRGAAAFKTGQRPILTSSVDVLPLLASLASGSEDVWMRDNVTYSTLWASRLSLFRQLFQSDLTGRSFVLQSYDEPAVQTDPQGNPAKYHLVSYRSERVLLCGYFLWNEGTQRLNLQSAQWHAFDQPDGQQSLELNRRKATTAEIRLLTEVITNELRKPMTGTLNDVSSAANRRRVLYNQSAVSDAIPGVVWNVVDW
jgi:arylsulfatase A-like enzyme